MDILCVVKDTSKKNLCKYSIVENILFCYCEMHQVHKFDFFF